jgi:hypothetical protein
VPILKLTNPWKLPGWQKIALGEVYRAVLQVAVAYFQIERGNYNGAAKMFLRLRQWIDPLPDYCRGIDIAGCALER